MKRKLTKGDWVKVYHDPVTKKMFEGEAVIRNIELTPDQTGNQWWCKVQFEDGFRGKRFIDENDLIK